MEDNRIMDSVKKKELQILATKARLGIIEGVYNAKSGHPGGSLSAVDMMTYIYFNEMNIDVNNPKWDKRDRFVLSKGHCAPALYSVLSLKGFFPVDELKTLRKVGSRLQGHPDMKGVPGVDMSTGSLGQGISAACGMALSAKLSGDSYRVYTMLGDGELQEGMVWEASMLAAHYKLDNLVAVIDNNGLQIDGKITDVCSPEPITDKFKAFGWNVININAHNFDEISDAFANAKACCGKPTVIIQNSVKGKGVSFMENNVAWHGNAPAKEQYDIAIGELMDTLNNLQA